jgi:radical SAM protein with 4Fe4S-binding SPASM domain
VKAAQDVLQRRTIHRTFLENRRQTPCYAGRLNLVMTECGDLYPCENFSDGFRLGNVRESGYDVGKSLKGGRADKVLARVRGGCFCTHECYTMTNILFNPRKHPALLLELLRIRPR